MAVSFDGGVVLGADSRTTSGSYIGNRVSDKLTQLDDFVFCCRSGSAAATQAVADVVSSHARLYGLNEGEPLSIERIAILLQNITYSNRESLSTGFILAGWDRRRGGVVYDIPHGGSLHPLPFAIGGSGSAYIYGHCDNVYRPGMSKSECVSFVVNALSLAMARDGSSGGVIRLAIIDSSGVERRVILGNEIPRHWEN